MCGGSAAFRSISRLVELDEEAFVRSLPAEDVRAWSESDVGYCYRRLDEKIVRVFAVGGVPRSNKDYPCNDFSMRIDDPGGGTHLSFNAFFLHGSAQWQRSFKFLSCGGTPTRLGLGADRRWNKYQKKSEEKLHRGSLI